MFTKIPRLITFFTLSIFLLFSFTINVKASTTDQIVFIAVNDELVEFVDARPFVADGVTYVPLRSLATILKANVFYNSNENSVIIKKDSRFLKIYITENKYVIEAADKIEVAKLPFLIKTENERVMVPLQFIAEYFQLEITFFEAGPIARLIEKNDLLNYTDEQLYVKYKEEIEVETERWKAERRHKKINKIAYLTFDDGPNKHTKPILDILQEHDVKATFFMIEPQIKDFKDDVQRMIAEGHMIGSHSVTHDKATVYQSPKTLLDEMNKTRETLLTITSFDSRLVRVPYGSKPYLTKEFRDILANNNIQVWDWNVDSNDWRYSQEMLISTVKKQVIGLEQKNITPVILFHNSLNTVQSLPEIIKFLKSEGYFLEAYDREHHIMINFWNDERL